MSRKANAWLPCVSDFAAGDFWRGGAGMMMQGSLVLWPLAYHMARRAAAGRAMDERLRRMAEAYAVKPKMALPLAEPAPAARDSATAWPAAA